MASLFQDCVVPIPPGQGGFPGPPHQAFVDVFQATPSLKSNMATPLMKIPILPPCVAVLVPVFSVGFNGS